MLHIRGLARNLIYVSKMADATVNNVFEKCRWKMVRGEMVLMRGVHYRTMYKLLGRTIIDGCNNTIFPERKNEENNVPDVSGGEARMWHQRLGHIGEKGI